MSGMIDISTPPQVSRSAYHADAGPRRAGCWREFPPAAGSRYSGAATARRGIIVPAAGTIVAVRVLDRPARINLRAFPTKRTVSGSPPGPSAFIGD